MGLRHDPNSQSNVGQQRWVHQARINLFTLMSQPDPAILAALPGPSSDYSIPSSLHSVASFGTATTINKSGVPTYFLKCARSKNLIEGEYNALNLISRTVPGFCPDPVAAGQFSDGSRYFVVASLLKDLRSGSGRTWERKLAEKLAKLHTDATSHMYGLPGGQVTCCGATEMPNPPTKTWSEFYGMHRLQFILDENTRVNGRDVELDRLGRTVVERVVPRLLGSIKSSPSLVHGDLWAGNAGAINDPETGETIPVVYDACAFYADSEYELGIMRMFGGFTSGGFYQRYHELVPEKEPKAEYDDRIRLYRLFHELNHAALFGGGWYLDAAKSSMRTLIRKYG
ncbi:Fructosamine kinase-domain-containing protein [Lipomyces kononenkoae]|uniref:Fructosamine kinase-domain-containing protein n=1 Tax=Lipomyces kononenkoae TaxID=34357 RepID=A0ACC3T4U2_LIPKO